MEMSPVNKKSNRFNTSTQHPSQDDATFRSRLQESDADWFVSWPAVEISQSVRSICYLIGRRVYRMTSFQPPTVWIIGENPGLHRYRSLDLWHIYSQVRCDAWTVTRAGSRRPSGGLVENLAPSWRWCSLLFIFLSNTKRCCFLRRR